MILECIKSLDDSGIDNFDSTMAEKQVKWPWNATQSLGTVVVVTDTNSVFQAITKLMSLAESFRTN